MSDFQEKYRPFVQEWIKTGLSCVEWEDDLPEYLTTFRSGVQIGVYTRIGGETIRVAERGRHTGEIRFLAWLTTDTELDSLAQELTELLYDCLGGRKSYDNPDLEALCVALERGE